MEQSTTILCSAGVRRMCKHIHLFCKPLLATPPKEVVSFGSHVRQGQQDATSVAILFLVRKSIKFKDSHHN